MAASYHAPIIVLLGPAGSGKSTFISHLVVDEEKDSISIDHGLEFVDSGIRAYKALVGGRKVVLVDTPGLEPGLEDVVVQKIVDWKVKERLKHVDGIVLLFPMVQGRLSDSMRSGLLKPKLDKIFGSKPLDDRYQRLALVTTRWSDFGTADVDPETVKKREEELRDEFGWRIFERAGAFFRHYDNTVEEASKIILMIVKNPPIFLVLGPSGAGRSSFIKHLLDDIKVISIEDQLTPVTTHVQPYGVSIGEDRVFLVDTPGIDDPTKTFEHIDDWMKKRRPRLETIDGVIFFLPIDISHGDIEKYMRRNLVKPALTRFLDVSRNKYTGLVFVTSLRLDGLTPRYAWTEEEVRDKLGTLESLGAKMRRYDNTLESAKRILAELVPSSTPPTLVIGSDW